MQRGHSDSAQGFRRENIVRAIGHDLGRSFTEENLVGMPKVKSNCEAAMPNDLGAWAVTVNADKKLRLVV